MSDKPDDSPPRLTGASKSYNLDGDTAEFDPGALQVHEFSPEMRQQISATKLPRFKPRTPKLEPVPPAKKRLSQRFLRVVGMNEPVPVETHGAAEEYEIAPVDPAHENARDAPTVPATRTVALGTGGAAGRSRGSWQWGLLVLCLVVGVLCFWLTRPPSVDPPLPTAPQVHAGKNELPSAPNVAPPALVERVEPRRQEAGAPDATQEPPAPTVSAAVRNSSSPTTPEPKPPVVARSTRGADKASKTDREPKTENTASSTPPAEPQSVFDTAIRPPAVRTRRN
jgi:hypothetical protein